MAAERNDFGAPDLSGLSKEEKHQVFAVLQRAKEFEAREELHLMSTMEGHAQARKGRSGLRKISEGLRDRVHGRKDGRSLSITSSDTGSKTIVAADQNENQERQPLEGLLYKYTNVMKGWQYRWFVLEPDSGRLEYYEKEEHKRLQRPRGLVHLAGAVISPSDEDSQTFIVNAANGEIYRLRAFDAKERQHWVNRLRATAEHHTDSLAQNAPPIPKESRPHSFGSQHSLQMRQNGDSHENLHACTTAPPRFPGRRPRTLSGSSLNTVLSPKHHKSSRPPPPRPAVPVPTADSLKNVKEIISQVQNQEQNLIAKIEELPTSGEHINSLDKEMLVLKATSSATLACLEQCLSMLQQQQTAISQAQTFPAVPNIEWLDPKAPILSVGSRSITSPVSPADSFVSAVDMPGTESARTAEALSINHDEDVEDLEEYSDTDLGAVDEHKSIILHLLSQLKLGMDLTKVVLPTFILEKRSLLEMFADCMAHPDLFLRVTDMSSPEARMIALVEWYLTSFHAGRKGALAKKPYNPIIGETFHCSWRLPKHTFQSDSDNSQAGESQPDTDTNATEDVRLFFCAEQVSHHPPISAFYFECPEKETFMNASIWTKSKFMGMSIGVVMIGKVCVGLLAHDEEYHFTLPSAYARSILTVPWVELGDRVTISCPKTGYSASVTFHTKPFYGGKLHKVTSEVKNPAGEVVCRVNGEWNGSLEFSHANGNTRVVDTTVMETKRKWVRPLEIQGDFESRRLWRNVTESLKSGDIDTATQHKRFLEERQRQGERHRKETNTRFPTHYFHEEGEAWVYNTPLKQGQQESTA